MSNKVYVDVLAEFSKDGILIPKEITWEDGRKYEITRVNAEQPVPRLGALVNAIPVWWMERKYFFSMKITICGLWKEPEPDMIVC